MNEENQSHIQRHHIRVRPRFTKTHTRTHQQRELICEHIVLLLKERNLAQKERLDLGEFAAQRGEEGDGFGRTRRRGHEFEELRARSSDEVDNRRPK